jgi:hypothetical protein
MLFVSPIFDLDDELSCGDGLWSRGQLEWMNQEFTAAVERALELGLESRAAAAATYSRNAMNGKQYIEAVIEAAWRYLLTNMDEGKDVTSVAIVARCPGVSPELVRVGFKRRLASWIGEVR